MTCWKNDIYPYLTPSIRSAVSSSDAENISEIRLRSGRPVTLTVCGQTLPTGCPHIVSDKEINEVFRAICEYSVHSYADKAAEGYVTLRGGHRVGVAGSISGSCVRYVSGLNFRIARELIGCADRLLSDSLIVDCISKRRSFLIAGAPLSGKTTLLRDVCRQLSKKFRVSVADERGELAAMYKGVPQLDIGVNTDVFDGGSRSMAVSKAVRVMSPQFIAADEIGSSDDIAAVEYALNSGAAVIATAHGGSIEEIFSRRTISPLLKAGGFSVVAFVEGQGCLKSVKRTESHDKAYWDDNACDDLLSCGDTFFL